MIHSGPLVQTENFDSEPAPPEPVETPARRPSFPLPAEYYSTPPGGRPPIFPSWMVAGCGSLSIVLLVVLFGTGYAAAHGGLSSLTKWFFSQSRGELAGMYTKDVTAAQKAAFDAEMNEMQKNVDAKRVGIEKLQPLLSDIRGAMSDQRVTPQELEKMTGDARAANAAAKMHSTSPR